MRLHGSVRRALSLWVVLFAAYAATLGIPSFAESPYAGGEPHVLLTAESIVVDRDLDVMNQFRQRAYAAWYPYELEPRGRLTRGRAHDPDGMALALAVAPTYAVGGPLAVQVLMAAVTALAFVLAAVLARRVVPEPWASLATLGCALSPPVLAHATAVSPELMAGALLAGAALLALRAREDPRLRWATPGTVLLAAAPWLSVRFAPAAAVIALALVRWLLRRQRRFAAFFVGELLLFSAIFYATINQALYGGPTPHAAAAPGQGPLDATWPLGFLERSHRVVALWIDRDYGALRWAPVIALAFGGVWLLYRSRREHLAVVVRERIEVEVAALLCALVCAAQVLVAVFLTATMFGFWFPGRNLLAALPLAVGLVAWGLRHAPKVGGALMALTLITSGWLVVELYATGRGWVGPQSRAPLGPLEILVPDFASTTVGATIAIAAAVTGAILVVVREASRWRTAAPGR